MKSWLCWCLLLGPVSVAWAAGEALAPTPPVNILLIMVDDLNVSLGCYGAPAITPNIDRLAARGTRFDRAYCQYPLCNPSRVSLLTGRRPENTGVYELNRSSRQAVPDAVTLPGYFRAQGRFTAGAGKIFHTPKQNDVEAWDFYEDIAGQDPEENAALKARYGGGDGRPAWVEMTGDGSLTRDGRNARTIVQKLAEATASGRPFFIAAGFHKPHLPWTAPRKFFDLYPPAPDGPTGEPALQNVPAIALQTELTGFPGPDSRAEARRAYYACVSFIDAQVGLLCDELDRRHLWESTLVVLVGDNGFHLGDHGGLWAKLSAFDESTRVPFLIAGPGVPAGRVVTAPVELLDLYPTLVSLAGLPLPAGLEGKSLVALMREPAAATAPARSLVFHYDPVRGIDIPGRSVIAGPWRYTEWAGGQEGREFYWRSDDHGEYQNRATDPEFASQVAAAAALLHAGPEPKPGPAERPRALLPPKAKKKEKAP